MGKKIKILQVTAVDTTVHHLLRPMLARLGEEGYDTHIACSPGPYSRVMEKEGYKIWAVPISRSLLTFSHAKAVWELYKLFRREQFDIVHVHTPIASALARVAAKISRIPHIIYTAHGFYFHDRMQPFKRRIIILAEKFLGRCCTDLMFTVSGEDRDTALREGIIKPDKVVRINGVGVKVERFRNAVASEELRNALGLSDEEVVVGFIGRIVKEKGILELIQAMSIIKKRIPETKLLIIGDLEGERDTQTKSHAHQLLDELNMRNDVIFTGMRDDVPELLQLVDVFTLPSYREGMPVSIVEAMASRLPVVATDIRGCREEVVDGVTGKLVPVGDVDALASALIELLTDKEKMQRMGEAGYERASQEFDEHPVLETQIQAYRRLLEPEQNAPAA